MLVLPDDPEAAERMFGAELLKNIDTANPPGEEVAEPVRNHTVVFAPEPDDAMERLKTKNSASLVAIIGISLAVAVCAAAAAWIYYVYR